jgi:hypothetical protein
MVGFGEEACPPPIDKGSGEAILVDYGAKKKTTLGELKSLHFDLIEQPCKQFV